MTDHDILLARDAALSPRLILAMPRRIARKERNTSVGHAMDGRGLEHPDAQRA
jgi:hypothetical protein